MTPEKFKRKLTAILSADVKGYSCLMGEDEELTLRTSNAYKEVMGSFIQQYRDRIVGGAGDSVLAEFASVGRLKIHLSRGHDQRNLPLGDGKGLCAFSGLLLVGMGPVPSV
jgi:class 3 adenylate cyclase